MYYNEVTTRKSVTLSSLVFNGRSLATFLIVMAITWQLPELCFTTLISLSIFRAYQSECGMKDEGYLPHPQIRLSNLHNRYRNKTFNSDIS